LRRQIARTKILGWNAPIKIKLIHE